MQLNSSYCACLLREAAMRRMSAAQAFKWLMMAVVLKKKKFREKETLLLLLDGKDGKRLISV